MIDYDKKIIVVLFLCSFVLDFMAGLSIFFTVAAFQAVLDGEGWLPAMTGILGLVATTILCSWSYRSFKAQVKTVKTLRAARPMKDGLKRYYEERFGLN